MPKKIKTNVVDLPVDNRKKSMASTTLVKAHKDSVVMVIQNGQRVELWFDPMDVLGLVARLTGAAATALEYKVKLETKD